MVAPLATEVDVRLASEERADLAAFLGTLTPEQRHAPTLCPGWRVRDLIAHVISYDNQSLRSLAALAAQAGFRLNRINDMALARYARHSPQQLLDLLAGNSRPRGLPAVLGGRAGLVEAPARRAAGPRTPAAKRTPLVRLEGRATLIRLTVFLARNAGGSVPLSDPGHAHVEPTSRPATGGVSRDRSSRL
jgi:uncharacterized protein (TIGR03083 family)